MSWRERGTLTVLEMFAEINRLADGRTCTATFAISRGVYSLQIDYDGTGRPLSGAGSYAEGKDAEEAARNSIAKLKGVSDV